MSGSLEDFDFSQMTGMRSGYRSLILSASLFLWSKKLKKRLSYQNQGSTFYRCFPLFRKAINIIIIIKINIAIHYWENLICSQLANALKERPISKVFPPTLFTRDNFTDNLVQDLKEASLVAGVQAKAARLMVAIQLKKKAHPLNQIVNSLITFYSLALSLLLCCLWHPMYYI
jgi:hypothetical protein